MWVLVDVRAYLYKMKTVLQVFASTKFQMQFHVYTHTGGACMLEDFYHNIYKKTTTKKENCITCTITSFLESSQQVRCEV